MTSVYRHRPHVFSPTRPVGSEWWESGVRVGRWPVWGVRGGGTLMQK